MKSLNEIINEGQQESLFKFIDVVTEYFNKYGDNKYASYFEWCGDVLGEKIHTSFKAKSINEKYLKDNLWEYIREYSEYVALFFGIVLGEDTSIDDAMELYQENDDPLLADKNTKNAFWKTLIKVVAASTGKNKILDQKLPKFK